MFDFYAPAAKLCVEVDGEAHGMGDRPARDARRDAWLAERGIETLRVSAAEIMADPDEMAWAIARAARGRVTPS